MSKARWLFFTMTVILIAAFALTACQPSAATVAPSAEAPAESAPTEAAPTEESPTVGGRMVFASIEEPDTLDIYKSAFSITSMVTSNIGAALVAKDVNGEIVPYLAKSWDISEDGLVYTFHLRDDVKFHNGDPFTANDYVWTWERCLDKDFVCPVSASMLSVFTKIEAPDDYTLVLTLAQPNYYTLSNLGAYDYLQPLDKNVVESVGETYGMGTTAVGVGPYMIKDWIQDEKIVLTRNPDFTWGPEFFEEANKGPYYVEEYEFRIIPDLATQLAGLEANELDYSMVQPKDLQTVTNTGFYQIYELDVTHFTYLSFNLQNPKFADLKVRQALNKAINREAILQVALNGKGAVLDGPLAPAMIGYDPEVMKDSGAPFDLEGAKALMEESGYTYGSDGMLKDPDGNPYQFTLLTTPDEQATKISSMAVDMWKQLGVAVNIEQLEWGTMAPKVFAGDYEICSMGIGWPDADLMYMMYHSSNIGAVNFAFTQDPDLDALLEKARTEIDQAAHQQAVNAAYKMVQDKAYMIPLFNEVYIYAISKDFKGVVTSPYIGFVFSDVYYIGE